MKKVVSRILAVVLMLTTLQGLDVSTLKAADTNTLNFSVSKKILKATNKGLEEAAREDKTASENVEDTALIKWDISAQDEYILNYYIQDKNKNTKRVELSFTRGADKTDLKGAIYDMTTAAPGTKENVTYTKNVLNNTTGEWESSSSNTFTNKDYIENTFNMGNAATEYKTFDATVGSVNVASGNLKLRIKMENNVAYVYTNGFEKGIVSKITIKTASNVSTTPDAQISYFNGPKDFQIRPVHLQGTDLTSTDTIQDLKQISPGSKPGIKVSFAPIRALSSSGKFVSVQEDPSIDIDDVILKLQPQYTLTSAAEDGDDSIRLNFTPKENAEIKVNNTVSGKVVYDATNDEMNLYLANKNYAENLDSRVIEWDALETSTIVDAFFIYGDSVDRYKPENKGHTYINFSLTRTMNNEVQFTIKPYNINSKAKYKISSAVPGTQSYKQEVVYEYDPSKTNNKEITAVVANSGDNYFKIEVSIDGNDFYSQAVYFNPVDYSQQPSTTTIKSVDNIYAVPSDENSSSSNPLAIGFDIEWKAPTNLKALLEKGPIYYELLLRKDKDDKDPVKTPYLAGTEGYAAYSKIFKVSLENNEVVVEPYLGTAGQSDAQEEQTAKLARYNQTNDSLKMENVSLMNFKAVNNYWEQIKDIPNDFTYNASTNYLTSADVTVDDSLKDMRIPNTYYLSMRTVYVVPGKPIVYSNESNLKPISLDINKEIIAVPGNVDFENATPDTLEDLKNVKEKVSVGNVDIQQYVKKMIEPTKLKLYTTNKDERYKGSYQMYLYAKKDTLKESQLDTVPKLKITAQDNGTVNLKEKQINGKSVYDILQEGGVVNLEIDCETLKGVGTNEFYLSGLALNEVYYMKLRTKLSPFKEDQTAAEARYSQLSKEFTFTTITGVSPSNPEDKQPPAPKSIEIKKDEQGKPMLDNTSVTLSWTAPDAFNVDNLKEELKKQNIEKVYYEFIRTNTQIDDNSTIEKLVDADETKVGFRSDKESQNAADEYAKMSTYTYKTKTWTELSPVQLSNKWELYDNTLNPNNIYYYYVRTVAIVNGEAVRSKWIMVPVTTTPIAPPINLKVESEKNYDYDIKKETVISFDAPIPKDANIPGDYEFEIAVKGENDNDYSTSKYSTSKLTSKQDTSLTPEGYTHFVYKIKDLIPGKRYDIKVRIKDKTKPLEAGGQYPVSLYCDKVVTATDTDEKQTEKEEKYEEYLRAFDSAVEKLRRRPYWTVEEDSVYKYREIYAETEVGLGKEYELIVGEDATDVYYYLPAKIFTVANEAKTILKVVMGDQTLYIRPDTLTEETKEIKDAIESIDEDDIEDYYVGVSFSTNKVTEAINGQKNISPRMTVDMELVYMDQREDLTEADISEAFEEVVKTRRTKFIKKLEDKLDGKTISKEVLQNLVDDSIEDIENDHAKDVAKIIKKHKDDTVIINVIDKNLMITTKSDAYAADGYWYNAGTWQQVDTYTVGNGFGIEADKLGTYIFTGQQSLINTVPELAPYQNTIAKYNLTDFFTLDKYSIQKAATRQQLYGAVARMMGASRDTDYTQYLKNNGIKGVVTLTANQPIRQDEAIYIIMQAYEKRSGKAVGAIMIKNKQSVKNIGAFQSIYRNYVYAAVELKVVDNKDSRVLPSKQMTVKEIIEMLCKVQAK